MLGSSALSDPNSFHGQVTRVEPDGSKAETLLRLETAESLRLVPAAE